MAAYSLLLPTACAAAFVRTAMQCHAARRERRRGLARRSSSAAVRRCSVRTAAGVGRWGAAFQPVRVHFLLVLVIVPVTS